MENDRDKGRTKVAVRHTEDVVRVRAEFVAERLVHMRWSMVRLFENARVRTKSGLGNSPRAEQGQTEQRTMEEEVGAKDAAKICSRRCMCLTTADLPRLLT